MGRWGSPVLWLPLLHCVAPLDSKTPLAWARPWRQHRIVEQCGERGDVGVPIAWMEDSAMLDSFRNVTLPWRVQGADLGGISALLLTGRSFLEHARTDQP